MFSSVSSGKLPGKLVRLYSDHSGSFLPFLWHCSIRVESRTRTFLIERLFYFTTWERERERDEEAHGKCPASSAAFADTSWRLTFPGIPEEICQNDCHSLCPALMALWNILIRFHLRYKGKKFPLINNDWILRNLKQETPSLISLSM